MPEYIAKRKLWLSHECRMVEEGERFSTEFPMVDGKPMRLSPDSIEPVKTRRPKAEEADAGNPA